MLSEMAAKTELAALVRESDRVRCLLAEEGTEKSLVADVMRMQLSIVHARIRQHCIQYGLALHMPQRELLPTTRPSSNGG